MELYGSYTSPFVRHCRIALLEAGLEFNFVETDAAQSAKLTPTQKVPFFTCEINGNEVTLTDSSAILKWIREKSGKNVFDNTIAFNHYCNANTLMDTAINLFYLEKDGVTADKSPYLLRQQSRLQSGLFELNSLALSMQAPYNDTELRIACFLDWALYRQRFTLDEYNNLNRFLQNVRGYSHFTATTPVG